MHSAIFRERWRTLRHPWACLLSLVLLGTLPQMATAQEGQGKFVTQSTEKLIRLIHTANKQDYSLQDDSFSLGGGWLKQSKVKWVPLYKVELKKGYSYRFIAAGDNDAKDVDIEVLDADGKVVAQDVKTDPEAVVDFTPSATGMYTVRLRLFDSENSVPCFCAAIVMVKKN